MKRGVMSAKSKKTAQSTPSAQFGREGYFVGMAELCERLGVSSSSIRRYVADGVLPAPIKPTPRRLMWPEKQIAEAFEKMTATAHNPL
ncbi:helix-turn-helix transcriptional regulator [Methylocystis parvus]|uniref:helix-turn-helix transcriptional regulator n=1 Tax=Methylocystis parvus TaxID=134 RepID=UPI003C769CA9